MGFSRLRTLTRLSQPTKGNEMAQVIEQLPNGADVLIRLEQVVERTTLSRATIYQLISEGRFPKQIQIGPRRVAWRLSDINEWIADRIVVTA